MKLNGWYSDFALVNREMPTLLDYFMYCCCCCCCCGCLFACFDLIFFEFLASVDSFQDASSLAGLKMKQQKLSM